MMLSNNSFYYVVLIRSISNHSDARIVKLASSIAKLAHPNITYYKHTNTSIYYQETTSRNPGLSHGADQPYIRPTRLGALKFHSSQW